MTSVVLSLDLFSLLSSSFFCFSSLIFRTPPKEVKVKSLSRLCLFVTPWIVAYQASPSMGFFRQEYWSGLPFPSPGNLPDPRIEPGSPALQADTLLSEPPGKPDGFWIFRSLLLIAELREERKIWARVQHNL